MFFENLEKGVLKMYTYNPNGCKRTYITVVRQEHDSYIVIGQRGLELRTLSRIVRESQEVWVPILKFPAQKKSLLRKQRSAVGNLYRRGNNFRKF